MVMLLRCETFLVRPTLSSMLELFGRALSINAWRQKKKEITRLNDLFPRHVDNPLFPAHCRRASIRRFYGGPNLTGPTRTSFTKTANVNKLWVRCVA